MSFEKLLDPMGKGKKEFDTMLEMLASSPRPKTDYQSAYQFSVSRIARFSSHSGNSNILHAFVKKFRGDASPRMASRPNSRPNNREGRALSDSSMDPRRATEAAL
jgi:hypothetical protein